MERIVLEVNDELAREKIRQAERENFFQLLDDVREEARQNGLTHDKLESLLNGD